jgi:hypothetical protein
MRVRIIYGKLRPGAWDGYEAAYREVMGQAGQIPGLCARWLTRDVDRPDAGYSISLWKDEASMRDKRLFENVVLPKLTPFFSGEYTTSRCEMRFLGKFRKAQPNAIAE